tara:strand:+ start:14052 stop:14234 length:183 start_codon:yes stop_codon:yes gene_type:complete
MTKSEKGLLLTSNQWMIINQMLLETQVKGADARALVELLKKVEENFEASVARESNDLKGE